MSHLTIVALGAWKVPDLYNSLALFRQAGIQIRAVVCAPIAERLVKVSVERAGEYFTPKSVYDLEDADLPFHFVPNHNHEICHALLRNFAPDVVLNLGTPNILKLEILSIPNVGTLNSHPGLLPEYRGCSCVEWAIFNGDPVGATCHFINAGIDEGPILQRRVMSVPLGTPYGKIRADMMIHQIETMILGLRRIEVENLYPNDLPEQGEGTYYDPIGEDEMRQMHARLASGKNGTPGND